MQWGFTVNAVRMDNFSEEETTTGSVSWFCCCPGDRQRKLAQSVSQNFRFNYLLLKTTLPVDKKKENLFKQFYAFYIN